MPIESGNEIVKKVLVIAYYFPPIQSSGVYRPLKFVKYLREFGWEPVVLTINAVCGHPKDEGLLDDIPKGVVIERTPQVDFYRLVNFLKRQKSRTESHLEYKTRGKESHNGEGEVKSSAVSSYLPIRSKLAVLFRDVFFIPDNEVPWLPIAAAKALRLAKKEKVDAVITTSPPHSVHLVGLLTKSATGLPWIVDFRDLWTDTFDFYPRRYGQWRRPVEQWMEKCVLRRADSIVNVSDGESDHLRSEYNDLPVDKFRVIHNGYDPEDFVNEANAPDTELKCDQRRLHITYVGTLYSTTADTFFDALSTSLEDDPNLKYDLELTFIGHIDPEYATKITQSNYRDLINIVGLKSHAEAVKAMCKTDVLLILHGGNKIKDSDIPGKIFEYMGAGKTILALARPGDIVSILAKSNLAMVVNPEDKDAIKQKLLELVTSKKKNQLNPRPNCEHIGRFSRKNLTRKLAKLLDEKVLEKVD
jgi:glycosyltransferase involved in cell wall biosynthesis